MLSQSHAPLPSVSPAIVAGVGCLFDARVRWPSVAAVNAGQGSPFQ